MSGEELELVRAALAAWTALAEPPDPAASHLIAALGPVAALEWVRDADGALPTAMGRLEGLCDRDAAIAIAKAHEGWVRRWGYVDTPLLQRAAKIGARLVIPGDLEWPTLVSDWGPLAPLALWVRGGGDLVTLWRRSVAIVGARASTSYGEHVTGEIAAGVADAGWTVVSGGAYGIDAAAHRSALVAGRPTVAVMAGGVDRLYPAGNEDLLRRILDDGCVLAEVPPGFAPYRSRFLARNRLIAAAGATVVIEAAARSGALNTAGHAAGLSRPVGAVPGPVTSASSAGSHALIRDGIAVLVTRAQDVLELAAPASEALALGDDAPALFTATAAPARPEFAAPHHRAAFDALSRRPRSVSQVAGAAGLSLSAARSALAALEIAGLAAHDSGNWRKVAAPLSAQK